MKTQCRWAWLHNAGLRMTMLGAMLGTSVLAGCQTWVPEAGMTMPSGSYLRHPPQYIPRSPDFPLTKELARQEEAAAQQFAPPLQP